MNGIERRVKALEARAGIGEPTVINVRTTIVDENGEVVRIKEEIVTVGEERREII